ncbi:MAG: D-alanyl-D-alanine carboxypeptidase family protein [Solirubrobacteraceae bacterium]
MFLPGSGAARRMARVARRRRLRRLRLLGLIGFGLLLAGSFAVAAQLTNPSRSASVRAAGPHPSRRTAGVSSKVHHRPLPPPHAYGTVRASTQIQPRLRLALRSGLLFDVRTGRVLWERAAARRLPIASLTKMMTALVVVAHARARDLVMITPAAVHFSGSGVGLLPLGHRVPLEALLYGLLLPSGNDAAIALAQYVAGSQLAFTRLMNARAAQMGLTCTHFSTVSGLLDSDNYSCASDLAVLAHAVLEQPRLARVVGASSAVLPFPIKGGKLYLYNNNPLLRIGFPGTDGVKTGYTAAAGPCLVASARRGGKWLGVVLLHSGNPAEQAITLLNAGFAAPGA